MIDPQTWLVAVAACGVIVAVWAWGILREDAAVVRAHASGIEAGRALERSAARGAVAADTSSPADSPQSHSLPGRSPETCETAQSIDPTPSTLSAEGGVGQPRATARRDIPAWLRTPGGGEGSR